jgi:PIN domain nuclease of toxin-antitoxin system
MSLLGEPGHEAADLLLELRELVFDRATAELAAALGADTSALGLGLADRACLATGLVFDALVVTADRVWAELDLPLDVQVVR